ncbi:MAG: DUF4345 domain-containing protein [Pseudomonadota bacterium]
MKRALQIALGLLAIIPGFFALSGLLFGAAPLGGEDLPAPVDNQLRYLSGVYLLVAFLAIRIIPRIEKEGATLTLIVAALFIGALGRLYSTLVVGDPLPQQIAGMALELGSPVLIIFQRMVAKQAGGQ